MRSTILTALTALLLSATTASAQWGTIKGRVAVKGDVPKVVNLAVTKDQMHCLSKGPIPAENWVVDPKSKGVKWVVVWIAPEQNDKANHKGELKIHPALAAVPKGPVVFDQPCCRFEPRAAVLRLGQDFVGKNSSPIAHNMYIAGGNGMNLNPIIPAGESFTVKAEKLNGHFLPTNISCSIHGWMSAKLFVFAHPYYAITDKDGNFEIKDAPAGKLRLLVWHEEAGWVVKESPKAKGSEGKSIVVPVGGMLNLGTLEVKAD